MLVCMRRWVRIGVGASLVVVLCASATWTSQASGWREVTKRYAGTPLAGGPVFCDSPRNGVDGFGRVCHTLIEGDDRIGVSIADNSGNWMAGRLVFFGDNTSVGEPPDEVGRVEFCNQIANVVIPARATHLDIEIGDRLDTITRPCVTFTRATYGRVVTRIVTD